MVQQVDFTSARDRCIKVLRWSREKEMLNTAAKNSDGRTAHYVRHTNAFKRDRTDYLKQNFPKKLQSILN